MLPNAQVAESTVLFFFFVATRSGVRNASLTILMEFKMMLPDGRTLQKFQAVVKSHQLGSSISVKLAQK